MGLRVACCGGNLIGADAALQPHLDIVHAHQIPTVVQVVFEVTVLKGRDAVKPGPFPTAAGGGVAVLTRYSNTRVRQRSVWMRS